MTPLILLALLAFADRPPLDAIVLIEDSPRTRTLFVDLSFTQGDRMAIATFNNKIRVKRRFTDNPQRIASALRPPKLGISVFRKLDNARIQVFDAILDANALFSTTPAPGRRRAIFVLFSSEDENSQATIDTLRKALAKTNVQLAAASLEGQEPLTNDERNVQTPPTRPGMPPVPVKHFDHPDRTFETLRKLTNYTQRNSWNLTRLIETLTGN